MAESDFVIVDKLVDEALSSAKLKESSLPYLVGTNFSLSAFCNSEAPLPGGEFIAGHIWVRELPYRVHR
jgi:hypothetical protein